MSVFSIKAGDTLPVIQATLLDARKRPIPLTGATVEFQMKPLIEGSDGALAAAADVVDVTDGIVKYEWEDGDTDVDGPYAAQFVITFGDGRVETVPNDSYLDVVILPALASP